MKELTDNNQENIKKVTEKLFDLMPNYGSKKYMRKKAGFRLSQAVQYNEGELTVKWDIKLSWAIKNGFEMLTSGDDSYTASFEIVADEDRIFF